MQHRNDVGCVKILSRDLEQLYPNLYFSTTFLEKIIKNQVKIDNLPKKERTNATASYDITRAVLWRIIHHKLSDKTGR